MIYYEIDYLAHHGVKGMKWGVRKQRPSSGNVRISKKKKVEYGEKAIARASKQYKRNIIKSEKRAARRDSRIYIDSYNQTAKEYNDHKIAEFNKKNSPKSKNYTKKYEKQFQKDWEKRYNKMLISELTNNRHYKKADKIAKKYGLYKVDDMAKKNKDFIETMQKNDYDMRGSNYEEFKKKYSD